MRKNVKHIVQYPFGFCVVPMSEQSKVDVAYFNNVDIRDYGHKSAECCQTVGVTTRFEILSTLLFSLPSPADLTFLSGLL